MTLTREQFDAAELETRRQLADRDFATYERAVLEFILRRSFRRGQTAAFFKTYRQLARAAGLGDCPGHAHEGIKSLIARRVLIKIFPSWYGINTTWLEWQVNTTPIPDFEDEPTLGFEPKIRALLTECFVSTNLSATYANQKMLSDRERGAVSAQRQVVDDKEAAGPLGPPSQLSGVKSLEGKNQKASPDWEALRKAVMSPDPAGTVAAQFPKQAGVPDSGTAFRNSEQRSGLSGVPKSGTFRLVERSEIPNAGNLNKDGPSDAAVPESGTFRFAQRSEIRNVPEVPASTASSAFCTKAVLAVQATEHTVPAGQGVPESGTPGYNERVAAAWAWLKNADTTGELKVERFARDWRKVCEKFPDYVAQVLPMVLARQIELHGHVGKPLALCAHVARADGKMR